MEFRRRRRLLGEFALGPEEEAHNQQQHEYSLETIRVVAGKEEEEQQRQTPVV